LVVARRSVSAPEAAMAAQAPDQQLKSPTEPSPLLHLSTADDFDPSRTRARHSDEPRV